MLDNESFWMSLSRCCQYVLRLFSRYLKETQVGLLSLLVLGLAGMVGSPSIRWSKIIWCYPSLWWSRSHYEWKYWLWWSIRILWSPSLGHPKGISIGSMDFDNPKTTVIHPSLLVLFSKGASELKIFARPKDWRESDKSEWSEEPSRQQRMEWSARGWQPGQ